MTDDWGIICGMQANAEGAVPEEGAGTTEGALTWYRTVRDFAVFWCSGGMDAKAQLRRVCGPPAWEAGTESFPCCSLQIPI
jgi:hypothetical protein